MRLKKVKDADIIVKSSVYTINNTEILKGKYKEQFKKSIHAEIGCGRGKFIFEMAKNNPQILFIAIDAYASVLVKLINKLENNPLDNLKIILTDANEINSVFEKDIEVLYLNFSDPWPKKRHYKRRLTSDIFLMKYESIFENNKKIIMKTDNEELFKYSLIKFSEYDYKLEYISFDLHKENLFNIQTEYEERFSNKGFKIFKAIVYK